VADIFLSYRRQDSQSATGRLADHLDAHFGAARVFRDHDSIVAGEDFADAIRRSVEVATVLLVVVGTRWLNAADSAGRRRLDDPHDFVRLEIELALAGDVAVVPVLVEDATMPSETDLPSSLAGFSRCQAVELSETRWRYDADRLVVTLQSRFAIEADAASLASARNVGADRAAQLATDLLDLAVHPKRLIARRQTGRASDHVRAFAFLAAAIFFGNVTLVVGLDARIARGASLALGAVSFASELVVGELVCMILAGLLAAVLALAWRLVGGGVAYRRVGVVAGYVYGGAWIGFCVGALILGSAMQLFDPTLFDHIVTSLQSASGGAAPVPSVPGFGVLQSAPFRGPATVLILVAFVIWVVAAGWCVVAWGAFRQAFAATRLQAAGATAIWLGVLGALMALGQRLS
jgi:hypothetical protein